MNSIDLPVQDVEPQVSRTPIVSGNLLNQPLEEPLLLPRYAIEPVDHRRSLFYTLEQARFLAKIKRANI